MPPRKDSEDSDREYTRTAWDQSAERYTKFLRNLEPFGFDLLARVDPKVRETCLDIATGPGEPAMSIARMVGSDGKVTGIDLSERMVQLARRTAADRRIRNIEFITMDAEKMDFPDGVFDLVVSRFGFQSFPHPEAVAEEAFRVLRPRGRIGVTVWGTAEKAIAINAIVAALLEFAEANRAANRLAPFELGGPGEMSRILEGAGFTDGKETQKTHTMTFEDENQYFDILVGGTPLGHSLREENLLIQKKILARTRENVRRWRTRRGIAMPCEGVIVTAQKGA